MKQDEITFDNSIKTRFGYMVIKEYGIAMFILGYIAGAIMGYAVGIW